MCRATALACAMLALLASGPSVAGDVAGRVTLGVAGTRLADVGPTVVFLDAGAGGTGLPAQRPASRLAIRQRDARFSPDFLVVTTGQGVEMPNDDTIFHNVFSFSRPNDFDLGLYPSGESRTVVFEHPGLVKIYCSIHESMSAALLVAPSPWFATVTSTGEYRIEGVPEGRYRLTAWNEKLPLYTRDIRIAGDATARVDVALGSADAPPTADVPAGPAR